MEFGGSQKKKIPRAHIKIQRQLLAERNSFFGFVSYTNEVIV